MLHERERRPALEATATGCGRVDPQKCEKNTHTHTPHIRSSHKTLGRRCAAPTRRRPGRVFLRLASARQKDRRRTGGPSRSVLAKRPAHLQHPRRRLGLAQPESARKRSQSAADTQVTARLCLPRKTTRLMRAQALRDRNLCARFPRVAHTPRHSQKAPFSNHSRGAKRWGASNDAFVFGHPPYLGLDKVSDFGHDRVLKAATLTARLAFESSRSSSSRHSSRPLSNSDTLRARARRGPGRDTSAPCPARATSRVRSSCWSRDQSTTKYYQVDQIVKGANLFLSLGTPPRLPPRRRQPTAAFFETFVIS